MGQNSCDIVTDRKAGTWQFILKLIIIILEQSRNLQGSKQQTELTHWSTNWFKYSTKIQWPKHDLTDRQTGARYI